MFHLDKEIKQMLKKSFHGSRFLCSQVQMSMHILNPLHNLPSMASHTRVSSGQLGKVLLCQFLSYRCL